MGKPAAPERQRTLQREVARLEQLVSDLTLQISDVKAELQKTRALTAVDPATDCLVERALHQRLEYEIARAARFRRDLAVLLVAADSAPGALARMAELCRTVIRATDVPGIAAPTELAIILPETPIEGALVLAARVQDRTGGGAWGCAAWPRDARTAAELLAAARRALRSGASTRETAGSRS
jgi:GGDEF domain-containing protein